MKHFLSVLIIVSFGVGTSAHAVPQYFAFTQPAMGTVFRIEVYSDDAKNAEAAAAAAFARIEEINSRASDYLPESELSRFNREPEEKQVPLSIDLFVLISRSLDLARLTDGAFDITATYAVQHWRRAKRQKKLPTPEQTARAVAMTNWRALQLNDKSRCAVKLKPGLLLNLGGIGKGYAADAALAVLKHHGFASALVAGSGDLAIGDPPPGKTGWNVALHALEHTGETEDLVHVTLRNCGCSTSGDLFQFLELDGKRYAHIVDPRTGLGLTERLACSVIAPDATTSDGLATGLCVLGTTRGLALARELSGVIARFAWPEGTTVKTATSHPLPLVP